MVGLLRNHCWTVTMADRIGVTAPLMVDCPPEQEPDMMATTCSMAIEAAARTAHLSGKPLDWHTIKISVEHFPGSNQDRLVLTVEQPSSIPLHTKESLS